MKVKFGGILENIIEEAKKLFKDDLLGVEIILDYVFEDGDYNTDEVEWWVHLVVNPDLPASETIEKLSQVWKIMPIKKKIDLPIMVSVTFPEEDEYGGERVAQ